MPKVFVMFATADLFIELCNKILNDQIFNENVDQ